MLPSIDLKGVVTPFAQVAADLLRARFLPGREAVGLIRKEEIRRKYEEKRALLEEEALISQQARAELATIIQSEREQKNIEAVVALALPLIEGREGTPPSEDWIDAFRKGAQSTRDQDIRTMWANVLKAEYLDPGSVGLRTLKIMESITKEEAIIFDRFMRIADDSGQIMINTKEGNPLKYADIDFNHLMHMRDVGLISTQDGVVTHSDENTLNETMIQDVHFYFDTFIVAVYKAEKFELPFESLTKVGIELMRVLRPAKNMVAIKAMLAEYKRTKYSIALTDQNMLILVDDMSLDQIEALESLLPAHNDKHDGF